MLHDLKQYGDDDGGHHTIWAGDFNVEVGRRILVDESCIMGDDFVDRQRNDRGERLLDSCLEHGLCLLNTFSQVGHEHLWTHRSGDFRKQLDYVISGQSLRPNLVGCGVADCRLV